MPDVTDLLRSGAGHPIAPLDLDRVERRAGQRSRNRRLAQAAVGGALTVAAVVGAVSLASSGTPRAADRDYSTVTAPDDVVPIDPETDPRLQPTPAAVKTELPDGNNFVIITAVDDDGTIQVDKVDRNLSVSRQAKCQQVDESYTYEQVFSFCWQNTNALLRTVTVKADVTFAPYGGEPLDLGTLKALVASRSAEIRNQVWSVRVVDSTITSIAVASLY
jgi:hypothetical protein